MSSYSSLNNKSTVSRVWALRVLSFQLCWLSIGVGCNPSSTAPKNAGTAAINTSTPRSVRTVRATVEKIDRVISTTGTLAPIDQATLSTKVAGRLELLKVDLGSEVRKGELIAQIEARDFELRLLQAQALLAQARAPLGLPLEGADDTIQLETSSTVKQAKAVLDENVQSRARAVKLKGQGLLPDAEFETVEAGFRVAETRYQLAVEEVRQKQAVLAQRRAEVETARQSLVDTKIYAPFSGRVTDRKANVGEILNVGTAVVGLVRMDPLRLRVEVAERDAQKIKIGQEVRLSIDGDTNRFTGQVKRLSPVIDAAGRTLTVEADFANNGGLRPGSFARAEIIVEAQETVLMVPSEAVISFAGMEKAFVVRDGKAVERGMITGRTAKGKVEVLSGIRENETVILAPGNLQNGAPIDNESKGAEGETARPVTRPKGS